MKLNSASSTGNLSPTKPKLKIGKAKSLIQKRQPAQFSPRSLKSKQSLAELQLCEVSEEIEYMGMFVDEVAMDPGLLLKLVDYQELTGSLLAENTRIKQKILQGRTYLENMQKSIFQMAGQSQSSTINLIRKQQTQTSNQIKKYLQLILIYRTSRIQKNQDSKNKQKRLQEQIKILTENQKAQVETIMHEIKKNNQVKIQLGKKIKQLEHKNQQLIAKFQSNKIKARLNSEINSEITAKRLAIGNLKKKENQELENYKNLMVKKKTNQVELKKDSEKKLSKFINELTKIVQNMDRKSFSNLVVKYEDRKQEIRDKNFSSDTKPDQNDEDQNTLENLELKNPLLKEYKSMNVKTLNEQILTPLHTKDSNRLAEQEDKKAALLIDQKIKKINDEEVDLDGFLDALKEKINKINTQLKSQKGSHILK